MRPGGRLCLDEHDTAGQPLPRIHSKSLGMPLAGVRQHSIRLILMLSWEKRHRETRAQRVDLECNRKTESDACTFVHFHILDASRELPRETFDQSKSESFFRRELHAKSIIRD